MAYYKILIILLTLLYCNSSYSRQNEIISKSKQEFLNIEKKSDTISSDLFNTTDILKITFILDFNYLFADTNSSANRYSGMLVIDNPDGYSDTLSIFYSIRGKFRKNPENCDFPLLNVYFPRSYRNMPIFRY